MTQSSFIYALVDPLTDRIRYIGQTNDLERRYKEHCTESDVTRKGQWVAELRTNGLKPTLIILEEVDDRGILTEREIWWIAFGVKSEWSILNATHINAEIRFDDSFPFGDVLHLEFESNIKDIATIVVSLLFGVLMGVAGWIVGNDLGGWFVGSILAFCSFAFSAKFVIDAVEFKQRGGRNEAH